MLLKLKKSFPLYEGVSINKSGVCFNFDKDNIKKDTLFLTQDSSFHKTENGYEYFAAYTYNKGNVNYKSDAKIIRTFLKDPINVFDTRVENFVDNGVLRFDNIIPCEKFDVIISAESTTSPSLLNNVIEPTIIHYGGKLPTTIRLIKNCYDDIRFNEEKVITLLQEMHWDMKKIKDTIDFTKQKFIHLKNAGELFKIKRFLPPVIRKGFENYLIFKNDSDKALYFAIQNGNVLLFDDFVTSGATIEEMMRYLNAINPATKLYIFILIDQLH